MSTRDSVLGEYYGVASDCVERNGAIAAMADEIVKLREELKLTNEVCVLATQALDTLRAMMRDALDAERAS